MSTKYALLREILITLLMAAVVYFGLNFSLQSAVVIGQSMEPNLHDGERVLISKLAYRFGGEPKRGDVIVFTPPKQLGATGGYVKRVIGLPGERVEINNGSVYIHQTDGTRILLDESAYLNVTIIGNYISGVIPKGEYFVMGDNRNNSGDSRSGWTVPKSDIIGRTWVVIWPPSKWGLAPNHKVGVRE